MKANSFVARCQRAGFGAEMTDDIQTALWTKFIGLAANAALTSAARLPAGPLYSDPDVVEAAAALIAEGAAVARAAGAKVAADIESVSVGRLKQFPPGMYASMYFDIGKGGPLDCFSVSRKQLLLETAKCALALQALEGRSDSPDILWARRAWSAIRGARLLVQEVFLHELGP